MRTEFIKYEGNQLVKVTDDGYGPIDYSSKHYQDGENAQKEMFYDKNGTLVADLDRKICAIQNNLLTLPEIIQFTNGNQIVHHYDAMGNRLRTTYYTRKVALVETDSKANECSHLQFAAAEVGDVRFANVEPATNTIPGTDNLQEYSAYLDDGVIYPNPYITITPQGYTKHYYVGQERFATALGLGGWNIEPVAQNAREVDMSHDWFGHFEEYYPFGEITSSTTNNLGRTGDAPVELQYECNSPMQLYSLHVLWDYDMFNTCIYSYLGAAYAPDEIFYIHPDHLGSASWITNKYAEPEQYIHYAPYGELLANQQVNTYDERY